MRRSFLLAALLLGSMSPLMTDSAPATEAALPAAADLLRAMDDNLQFDTRTSEATMRVVDGTRTREYRMRSYARGVDEAAVEYLAPEREKGTRMLKKDDQLWLYMPRAERVQKVSGHMMRQGMMGSDVSYEDMLAASQFVELYDARTVGSDEVDGRDCWRIEAIAKDDTVSYPKRVMWVDKEHSLPVKQELYALSGMLLKTWTMSDVQLIEGRQVPMKMVIADQLREGSRTELITESVQFGVALEEEVFSLRWLERH